MAAGRRSLTWLAGRRPVEGDLKNSATYYKPCYPGVSGTLPVLSSFPEVGPEFSKGRGFSPISRVWRDREGVAFMGFQAAAGLELGRDWVHPGLPPLSPGASRTPWRSIAPQGGPWRGIDPGVASGRKRSRRPTGGWCNRQTWETFRPQVLRSGGLKNSDGYGKLPTMPCIYLLNPINC